MTPHVPEIQCDQPPLVWTTPFVWTTPGLDWCGRRHALLNETEKVATPAATAATAATAAAAAVEELLSPDSGTERRRGPASQGELSANDSRNMVGSMGKS